MNRPVFHAYDSREALAEALAAGCAAVLAGAIATRGVATLAVSGGSTPKLFLDHLSRAEIDWKDVEITLVDERWVPETSDRSNHAMVRAHLMKGPASEAHLLPFYTGHETPEEAVEDLCERYRRLTRRFDVAVLGMGTDGHTASFFPGADNLHAVLDPKGQDAVAAVRAPGAGEPRITLTLPLLVDARLLCLHIEGEEKRAVYDQALAGEDPSEMPVRAVLNHPREEPLNVFWAP
ncbi:6-phosphogluconolactonase [Fulvimarina manganoxydans]|uniref:6-phosphogluconolactonase n=1 Tax=Fulvimarina manganoxydans TaxID=937218 RepID=A0A1W2EK10_9HYPH|nr:6-phosphogluconolactonase [Fulvimarina manganoxydans]MEE2952907.1 6-phosphogluconolactonase [Pseudomonadota bacterium]SMD09646.1 6-phosphogluconolactonase [Fulvimarina manganoxydans]